MLHLQHDFCLFKTPTNIKKGVSLRPSLLCPCHIESPCFLPSPPYPMPESSPSQRHSAPAGCFKMQGAEHDAMEQQLFSALSIFFLTPPPPDHLLHHCSATTNSSAQISCKLPIQTSASLASAPRHMLAHKGHTSADLPRNNTYPPRVAVQHARRCCIDICSMICIETDRASVCV